MNNWRLLLFAFVAVFEPIASFTERSVVDGRCSERDSNLLRISRLAIYGSRLTKPADERRDTRNDIRSENSFLTRLATDKRDSADNRARDLSRDSRISVDRGQRYSRVSYNFRGERLFDTERTGRDRDSRVNAFRDSREERFRENQRDRSARYVRDNRDSELRERRDTRFEQISADRDLGHTRSAMLNVQSRRFVEERQVRAAHRQINSRRERENVMRAETDNERREMQVSRTESERRLFAVRSNFRDENARDRNVLNRRAREVEERRTTSLDRSRGARELRSSASTREAERDERQMELRSSSRFNRVSERRMTREESRERNREIRDERVRIQRDDLQERRERQMVRDARILNRQIRSESRDQQLESRDRRIESRDRQIESRDRKLESRLAERQIRQSPQNREIVRDSRMVEQNRNSIRDGRFNLRREKREVSRGRNTQSNVFRNRELSIDRIRSESVLTRDFVYGKPTEQKETYTMTWHYLLYALQGAYICHVLIQMAGNKMEKPQKSRSLSWWFPAQTIKVD